MHKLMSKDSALMDRLGKLGLRMYLYRENLSFNPNLNGEYALLDALKSRGFDCKIAVDIGANVGNWAVALLSRWPQCQIHVVDPSRKCCERLRERYKNRTNIFVHNFAVGLSSGQVCFSENIDRLSHSIIGSNSNSTYSIEMLSGTDFFDRIGVKHVDFIKVDVEGYDLKVIKGLKGQLRQSNIKVIQFEHHSLSFDYGCTFNSAQHLLNSCGYVLGKIYPNSVRLIPIDGGALKKMIGPNFLAVSEKCLEAISLVRKN